MDRRSFVRGLGWALLVSSASPPSAAEASSHVRLVEREILTRRNDGRPITAAWIGDRLRRDFDPLQRRIAAFELVRNVPYKLTGWKGDPDSLFQLGRGDCRHKSAALIGVLRVLEAKARHVQVPFDWADLPIPPPVLSPLSETRGIHDSVEVEIGGQWVLVDPTWDLPLRAARFPVMSYWDGNGPTLPITEKATTVVLPSELKAGTNIYAQFGIRWPVGSEVLAFNRVFNAWSDEIRSLVRTMGLAGGSAL